MLIELLALSSLEHERVELCMKRAAPCNSAIALNPAYSSVKSEAFCVRVNRGPALRSEVIFHRGAKPTGRHRGSRKHPEVKV
jgi:hypothetical protein